jgi:hypothetical protein
MGDGKQSDNKKGDVAILTKSKSRTMQQDQTHLNKRKKQKNPRTNEGCGLNVKRRDGTKYGAKGRATLSAITFQNKTTNPTKEKFIFFKYPLLYPLYADVLSSFSADHPNTGPHNLRP